MKRACTKYRNLIAYRDIFTLQLKKLYLYLILNSISRPSSLNFSMKRDAHHRWGENLK